MSFNIVSTPIGNLGDISQRAIDTLRSSKIILCEKKPRALKLLNYFNIKPKLLIPYHDDKYLHISKIVIKELRNRGTISLISDAGTPLISDPGYKLVLELIKNGVDPISIPGPSSIISALTLSGIDISNFIFLGFLPKKKKQITNILNRNLSLGVPLVIFANSKKLKSIIKIIDINFKNSFLSVSKEISKINEMTRRGTSKEIINSLNDKFYEKGEFVLIIKTLVENSTDPDNEELLDFLEIFKNEGLSLKQSVNILKNKFKISKKDIYSEALKKWGSK